MRQERAARDRDRTLGPRSRQAREAAIDTALRCGPAARSIHDERSFARAEAVVRRIVPNGAADTAVSRASRTVLALGRMRVVWS